MENSSFQNCINILEKLRIISLSEGRDFMSICSSEILVNMEHLLKEDNLLNAKIVNRLSSDNFIVMGSSKSIFQQKFEGIKIKAKIQKDGSKIVDEYEMLIRDQTFSHEEHLLVFEDLINYLINKNIDYVLALNMCNEFSLYFKNDSRFQVKYFETLKDSGKISEAISLAKNYIETIEEVSFANCDYFVLAGKYLELICKSLINSKDDLIDKQSELSSEEYSKMTYNLRIEMISLAEQSKSIFLNLVKISFGNLTRKQKIVVSGGFLQLIKMIRRILKDKNNLIAERYELFSEICNYGINHFSPEIRDQLIKIKFQVDNNDLEEIIKDKKKGDSNKKLTDFGEKLLQALNKNKKV
jgi:hypothetical protein